MVRIGIAIAMDQSWKDYYGAQAVRQTRKMARDALKIFVQHFPQIEALIHQNVLQWGSPQIPFFGDYPHNIASTLAKETSIENIVDALQQEDARLRLNLLKRDAVSQTLREYVQPERRERYLRRLLGALLVRADGLRFSRKLLEDLKGKYPQEKREFLFGFTGRSLTQRRVYEVFGLAGIGTPYVVCKIPSIGVDIKFVVVHEFGHLLGGKHTTDTTSFMHHNYASLSLFSLFDRENQELINARIAAL